MSSAPSKKVRFLRLDRLFEEHRDEYLEAASAAIETGQVVGGPEVERFEERIARRTDRAHAIAVNSGTDAMIVLLKALGIEPGWSVMAPAYSFIATASPILHCGVDPTFVDVDPNYHLDLRRADECVAAGTLAGTRRAMIVVGLFGHNVDHDAVERFCSDREVVLIEDAAQSFGARDRDRVGGSLGLASILSFAPTKTLPCFGNLGAVLTDDDELADRVRRMRYHGGPPAEGHAALLGYNSVPAAISAAMLNVSLDHHDEHQRRRDRIAAAYLSALEELEGVDLPRTREAATPNWHKFVVRHPNRDALREHLARHGVETQVHYPTILPDLPLFANSSRTEVDVARGLAAVSLTLPLHAFMTDDEVDQVVACMRSFRDR